MVMKRILSLDINISYAGSYTCGRNGSASW